MSGHHTDRDRVAPADGAVAPDEPGGHPGYGLWRAGAVATLVFVVAQVGADIAPDSPVLAVAVTVSLAMFAGGSAAMLVGLVAGVARSRTHRVTLGGLFFMSDTAPDEVRRVFTVLVVVQVVAALATAAVRPFTPLAFGILAPMCGLGLMALWTARHGTFPTYEEAADATRATTGPAKEEGRQAARTRRGRRWWEPVGLDDDSG